MAKSLQKALLAWAIALLIFTLLAVLISYYFTGYQAGQLSNTLRNQYQQLQVPLPPIPVEDSAYVPEPSFVDVSSLLTQAAKQQKVDLHYQQDPERSEQWLVGVNGSYQRAVRFVASVMQAQQGATQAFPFTQTIKWQDTDLTSGKLSWQFLWLNVNNETSASINADTLFKTKFPSITAEPLQCLEPPAIQSETQVSDWSLVALLATQTSPQRKALLQLPDRRVITLAENSWIKIPLMQLREIKHEYAVFERWQQYAGCWSAEAVKLRLTKDKKPQ
ncbi:MAG: hypothetical protein ACQEQ2_09715 [Pseudomonadota bacterium]